MLRSARPEAYEAQVAPQTLIDRGRLGNHGADHRHCGDCQASVAGGGLASGAAFRRLILPRSAVC